MRLHILSDLHVEFERFDLPDIASDVIVLAGDVHTKDRGLKWAIENIHDRPVLYVLGNHEFYGGAHPRLIHKLKESASGTNVIVMEHNEVEIDGVWFFGCTLWSDFKLFGDPRIAGYQATQTMKDYRKIRRSPTYSKMRSIDTAIINRRSMEWLGKMMSERNGPKVVITHHAPSARSLPEELRDDIMSAAYASDFDEHIEEWKPRLWIHGHLHESLDYVVGETRIICNPRGYSDELNPKFHPDLVVEIH